jgi:hypothetical protein
MRLTFRSVLAIVLIPIGALSPRATYGSPAAAPSVPTFTRDVAPILYQRCVSCHRQGEVAPMALLTYEDARPWAKAIKQKVIRREMPPGARIRDSAHSRTIKA